MESPLLQAQEDRGGGGNLQVSAQEEVFIFGRGVSGFRSGLFSNAQFGSGDAGNLSISTPRLEMNDGLILASSQVASSGDGGNLLLEVDQLALSNGAEISTSTDGPGQGGTLVVQGRAGPGSPAGLISIAGQSSGERQTGLSSSTSGAGQAGSISIFAQTLEIKDRGIISTGSSDTGDAGEISIEGQTLDLRSGALIDSSTFDSGQGGKVGIRLEGSATISGSGTGLFTKAEGTGIGGDISFQVGSDLFLENGASVGANSLGSADSGNIFLQAHDTIQLENSSITTEAKKASGGDIKLTAETLIRLNGSTIKSLVQGDETTVGGNINLDPEFIILQDSQILATATSGFGGNILLVGDVVLVDPLSTINASSQQGVSGLVNIQAPTRVLSGTIAPLQKTPVSPISLYSQKCAGHKNGEFSSFTLGGHESIPPPPGGFLPTPLFSNGNPRVAPPITKRMMPDLPTIRLDFKISPTISTWLKEDPFWPTNLLLQGCST